MARTRPGGASGHVLDVGRDTAGRVQDAHASPAPGFTSADLSRELIDVLRAEVEDLRQANSELRRLLAVALSSRALPEPRGTGDHTSPPLPRPWWQCGA